MVKILIIGELCTDVYVYGDVNRLSPEAPIPVINPIRYVKNSGMAGNVYQNVLSLVKNSEVLHWSQSESITKTRYVHEKSNQMLLRVDEGESKPVDPLTFLSPDMLQTIRESDLIIISDYNKGFITTEALFEIVYSSKCPVFIDTKKTIFPEYNCYIKINDLEYSKLSKNYDNLIVTHGAKGAEYDGVLYPGERVNVYDVVGAGDTFLAGLVYGFLKYGRIEKAIPLANKASAIAVSNPGTYVLTEQDVQKL